jgi:hypothetical protein
MKSDARMLNEGHDLARVSTSARKSRPGSHSSLIAVVLVLATFLPIKAVADAPATHRRAIVIGRGEPFRDPDGGKSHPQLAKEHFLKLVGNPDNDPAKGWTVELSWDLMLRHGFDPKTDCYEAFFNFIGRNHPEFRILIQNGPGGADAAAWGTAVDNGMIAFAPHGNNMVNLRIPDEVGIKACCSVAGGYSWRENSYGPGLEFFDAMPDNSPHGENAWQSWANQALAAKCARVFDMHPTTTTGMHASICARSRPTG